MDTRRVQRGPARIAYAAWGHGPAVLLLASLGRGAEDFFEVAPLIAAQGFRVLAPDPRGIGDSEGPMTGLTLYDLAEDAAAVLEAEGTGPALVAGHAFGNWVARALSACRPELVRGVVLLAASITQNLDPAVRASIDGSFDPALSEAERLGHLQRGYFAPGHDARVWLTGWHPPVARMQRAATAATDQRWRRCADRHATLYVAAALDTIAPVPTEAALREALGDRVALTVIPDAGHALLPEQPAATAAAVVAFAGRADAARHGRAEGPAIPRIGA
ncbi:alpha/beta fold hydrolase [Paracraurococcus lichenis]|uniref:Alpha/beta hydrolase n=1 Tax=Paracraurococcus lichenis TaxID=3064888 RepID=A0ABT9DUX5_9PROT|nr:alpha/beta hydrolase [Paracraurococcus sp. LOR1-02]MDO9707702.1 alpha/beta hydrolase [Paracraurococcus sp. LOR1-02]